MWNEEFRTSWGRRKDWRWEGRGWKSLSFSSFFLSYLFSFVHCFWPLLALCLVPIGSAKSPKQKTGSLQIENRRNKVVCRIDQEFRWNQEFTSDYWWFCCLSASSFADLPCPAPKLWEYTLWSVTRSRYLRIIAFLFGRAWLLIHTCSLVQLSHPERDDLMLLFAFCL